jgi:hypothetical protein
VNVETKGQSKQWMYTYSPNKLKKFKQTSARKLMATVLGQDRSADGGTCALGDHSNVRSVLRNTKKIKLYRAIQNKRLRMLMTSVMLLHGNVRLHTAACTQALLEHFGWELFDHPALFLLCMSTTCLPT